MFRPSYRARVRPSSPGTEACARCSEVGPMKSNQKRNVISTGFEVAFRKPNGQRYGKEHWGMIVQDTWEPFGEEGDCFWDENQKQRKKNLS